MNKTSTPYLGPYILIAFILFCSCPAFGQDNAVIQGVVTDARSGIILKLASVKMDQANATRADSNGFFLIQTTPGKHTIRVSQVGYAEYEQVVRIGESEKITLRITLTERENELDRVVVTASKQEKKIATEVMSVTSIKPYLITNTNAKNLSDVLNNVPGISVVEGQAIIRGSVGWSYNVGSRVMVLLDDMPLMGPDVGDVQWDLLPIEAAENIEVLKGPSSVLYGSAASSGTVNVRTGWPTNKPKTTITIFQGVSGNPRNKEAIWWEETTQPFNAGTFFSHKQKFGQFDLVVSGNVYANRSHIQENDEFKARSYIKTRYRFKKIPGLSAGINSTLLYKKAGRYFLWENADSGALTPYSGSTGKDFYQIYSLDPHITYIGKQHYTISLRLRQYSITRFMEPGAISRPDRADDAKAIIQALDLNFQKNLYKNFTATTGVYLSRFGAAGNVYPDKHSGYTGAAFAQLEYSWRKWNITSGLRYEFNALDSISQTQRPLLRMGANYRVSSKTFLRFSYGEGFRFPTVGERYVQDNISKTDTSLAVFPNPDLENERGWNAEMGIKQGFNIGQFSATIDAAFFWMEYKNLIEFRFAQYEHQTYYIDDTGIHFVGEDKTGFKAVNRPLIRSAGYEIAIEGDGSIGPVGIRTLCGYTYTYPVDLNADPSLKNAGNYMRSFFDNIPKIDSGTAAMNSVLAYRNRHLFKTDLELSYKRFSVGYNTQYYSAYEKIDEALITAIPGLRQFMHDVGAGDWVHNVRTSFKINPQMTLAFLVNNLANHTYAIRPARLEPPRSFNMQIRVAF